MRILPVIVALATVVLSASGCAASHRAAETGTVKGTLGIRGGVSGTGVGTRCFCRAEFGTVRLIGARGARVDVTTDRSGRFSVRVPAGHYSIEAGLKLPYHWPMGSCGGESVRVVAGQTRQMVVVCQAG